MARASAPLGGGRHDLREWGVFAMVGRSEHHSLYANPRQHPQKEQPVLRSRAVHVSARKQPLYLSQPSEPRLNLYRDPQTLWGVLAKTAMHQCSLPVPGRSPARISPATRTGVGEHARVRPRTAAKKEGGSPLR